MKKSSNHLASSIEKLGLPKLKFKQFIHADPHTRELEQVVLDALGFEASVLGVSLSHSGNKLIISTSSMTAAARIYAQEVTLLAQINLLQRLPRCQRVYVHCAQLSWQRRFASQPTAEQPAEQLPQQVINQMQRTAEAVRTKPELKESLLKLAETLKQR